MKKFSKKIDEQQIIENIIGINSELITKVVAEIHNNNKEYILLLIKKLHPADSADLLETLAHEERKKLVFILKDNFPPEALPAMNVPILIDIIEDFEIEHLIKMLLKLDTDDIIYVLEICEEKFRYKIVKSLPKDLQSLIRKALNYDEDSAGRIMQTDYVSIPVSWNIGQVVDYLRMSKRIPDEFYALFAVDSRHIPIGTVPLHIAIRKEREVKISQMIRAKMSLSYLISMSLLLHLLLILEED